MIAATYVYLISTLPMLQFGAKPPFSFEKFLEVCSRYLSGKDIEILKASSISGDYDGTHPERPTVKGWRDFDTAIRNELVKIRASHKRLDPNKYIRGPEPWEPSTAHIAMSAHREPHILEGERMLDEARWLALSELEFGHYFDIDTLIIYAHKLLLLERWENIETAEKKELLKEIVWQQEVAA